MLSKAKIKYFECHYSLSVKYNKHCNHFCMHFLLHIFYAFERVESTAITLPTSKDHEGCFERYKCYVCLSSDPKVSEK